MVYRDVLTERLDQIISELNIKTVHFFIEKGCPIEYLQRKKLCVRMNPRENK